MNLDWMEAALCAQSDPEAWFPPAGSVNRTARAICARCPVAAQCAAYSLDHPELDGIWGATSRHERQAMRRVA